MVLPSYHTKWQPYSDGHEELERRIESILGTFEKDPRQIDPWAYAVVGTFGAGKTQLLLHIFKAALDHGLLPLFFLAEDLFLDIVSDSSATTWLPRALAENVNSKINRARESFINGDKESLNKALRPGTANSNDLIEELMIRADRVTDPAKVVVLVDELEQQYKSLQDRVQADERSPLREWLEQKDCLKFVALAPVGIYEMGGADQTRVSRLVIPPVDPWFVRKQYADRVGRTNAAWWLSRGKPRHIFKAIRVLNALESRRPDPDEVVRILRDDLDSIGQEPSKVPPAVLTDLSPSKFAQLFDLQPVDAAGGRRIVIDMNTFDSGSVAEKVSHAFNIDSATSSLITGYFRTLLRALTDSDGSVYLEFEALPELLQLALDSLLEYEHGSPGITERLGEILRLYESVDDPVIYGIIAPLWDHRETSKALPLSGKQLRQCFPFPVMNPAVKGRDPGEVKQKVEGHGIPVWRWMSNNNIVMAFASTRDFETYVTRDQFRADTILDGIGVICILPPDEQYQGTDPLIQWFLKNGKIAIENASPLVNNFLLSAAGEVIDELPGDLPSVITKLADESDDPITSRKVRLYEQAVDDLVQSARCNPPRFCTALPSDVSNIWGRNQISDHYIAVLGCALSFTNLGPTGLALAATARDLFKGDREGRGAGPLRSFLQRGGTPSLPDDLLPTKGRRRQITERPPVTRLRDQFGSNEGALRDLARSVPLRDFLYLEAEEDQSRVLEALWRCVRRDFGSDRLAEHILPLETVVISVVQTAIGLESTAIDSLGLGGIDFGEEEDMVRNLDGLRLLLESAKSTQTESGDGAALLISLYSLFASQLIAETSTGTRRLDPLLIRAQTSMDGLEQAIKDLRRNFLEYPKAVEFTRISEEDIVASIQDLTSMNGTPRLDEFIKEIDDATYELNGLSESLSNTDQILEQIDEELGKLRTNHDH